MVTRLSRKLTFARNKSYGIYFQKYGLYFLTSLLLSLIYSIPLFRHAFNNNALPLEIANDTLYYLTKIQSWQSSFGLPLNPYHENAFETISNYTFVIESFLAIIANITGLDTGLIYALATFISFNINFYLVMRLSKHLGLKPRFGLLAFLTSYVVLVPYAPYRPISPQINLTLYLLICLAMVSFFASNPTRKHFVILGLLQLLIWFVYPYFALLSSSLAFFYIIEKSRRNFRLAFVRLVSLILIPSAPWLLVNYFALPNLARQTALRTGLVESNHYPGAFKILLGSLILASFVLVARILQRTFTLNRFLIFQGLSIFFVSNSQVVTGKSLQFESHYILLFWLNTSFILFVLINHLFKSVFRILLPLVIFSLSLQSIYSYYTQVTRLERVDVSIGEQELWKFIITNTDSSDIISAPLDISQRIVYVTKRKVLATSLSRLYIMSDQELTQRVLLNHYPEILEKPIPEEVYVSIFGLRFRDALSKNTKASSFLKSASNHSSQIKDEEMRMINLLIDDYSNINIVSGLNRFGVDWIVRPIDQFDRIKTLSSNCNLTLTHFDQWGICRW